MFDWLKNLFSGGSKKPSSSISRPSGSSNSSGGSGRPAFGSRSSSAGSSGLRPPLRDDSLALARQREEEERKKREEEARKKKAAEAARKLEEAARLKREQQFDAILKKPAASGLTIDLDAKLRKAPVVTDTRSAKQKELDTLTAKNLPTVKAEMERNSDASMKNAGLFDKLLYKVTGKQGLDKNAQVAARNRAVSQVQERNGWKPDEEVKTFSSRTVQQANTNSRQTAEGAKNLKKAVDVARWLPGAGIGELGANLVRGNFSGSREADDRLLREQNELTQEQINQLSPENRNKFLAIAKGGLAAGILDVVGVGAGSLVKNGGRTALKKATTKALAKDIASKQGAKMLATNMGVGGAAGAGIGYGGTKALGGSDEEARQNAVTAGISGVFGGAAQTPFDTAVKLVKGTKSAAKNTRLSSNLIKGEAVDNVDAVNKVELNKVGTQALADDAGKIPNTSESNEPDENKIEVAPGVKTSTSGKFFETPRSAANQPVDNTPAYIRRQERQTADAQVEAATPLDTSVTEVPAYQRQGRVLASEQSDTARADEIRTLLPDMLTPEQIRVREFELRQELADKMRKYPGTANLEKFRRTMQSELDALHAQGDEARAMTAELDTLESRLGSSYQQRKTAQALQTEAPVQPALNIPDPANPIALAKGEGVATDIPMADFSQAVRGEVPLAKATPTVADAAEAAAEGDLRVSTRRANDNAPAFTQRDQVDVQGNEMLQSDVQVAQALTDQGIAPQRGNSVVATQEDAMAEEAARQATDGTNAPNTREQVVSRNITDETLRDDLMTDMPPAERVNLESAELNAKAYLNGLEDEQLVARFSDVVKVTDPTGFFTSLNAVRRLERINTPEADLAIRNALDSMTEYAAESGRGLRTVQVLFDDMPTTMKVDYLMTRLGKAGADMDDATRLRLTGLIEYSDDATSNLRGLEDQARRLLEDGSITNGNISPAVRAEIDELSQAISQAAREKELRAGEAYRFYQEQLNKSPEGGAPLGKRAGDVGRTLMLSAPSGRAFDILSTTATATDDILTTNVSNLIGKGVNLVKGRGAVTDTMASPGKLFKGFREGVTRTKEAFQGQDHVEDFLGEAKRATRGDINSGGSFVRKGIRAMVEMPTNLTRGLRTDELNREAMQEAAQLGLSGDAQRAYADVRSLVPTNAQLDKATDTHMRANMLHENGVSRQLNGLARWLDSKEVLGGWVSPIIRNQIAPFTSWLGGSLNRMATDKNVLWNAGHIVVNARRGNTQGVIDDVAKLAVNTTEAYAIGALLTQMGIITTEDANGDDYAGLYFHVGDRYIPVAAAGTVAVPIILGNAYEQAAQAAAAGENWAGAFANALSINTVKNAGVASVFGGENNLQSTVSAFSKGTDAADAAAGFVGNLVRQYIPAATADINAFLDQTALNPTGEAAETKVLTADPNDNGNKQDKKATEWNKTLNRIPFASQMLDRKEGVPAKDIIDRILRSTRETGDMEAKKEVTQSLADAKNQLIKDGVPTTSEDIDAFAKSGDYDKAIAGARYRLAELETQDDVPEIKKQAIRDKITKLSLEKDGVPTEDEGIKARLESGEYDSALRGYQYKLSNIENDKNVPESKKEEVRSKIKRTEIYRDGDYDPELVTAYEADKSAEGGIGVTEWREMMEDGDEAAMAYATQLMELDKKLFDAKIIKKAKYYWKGSSSGGRAGGRRSGSGGGRGGSSTPSFNVSAAMNEISFSPDKLQKRDIEFSPPQSAIPVIQSVQNYDTSKLRKVKVTKGVM